MLLQKQNQKQTSKSKTRFGGYGGLQCFDLIESTKNPHLKACTQNEKQHFSNHNHYRRKIIKYPIKTSRNNTSSFHSHYRKPPIFSPLFCFRIPVALRILLKPEACRRVCRSGGAKHISSVKKLPWMERESSSLTWIRLASFFLLWGDAFFLFVCFFVCFCSFEAAIFFPLLFLLK